MSDQGQLKKLIGILAGLCALAIVVGLVQMDWSSPPPLGLVEGTVTLDGKPLDTVEVAFLPDPTQGTKGARSACYTDAQGKFKLASDRYGKDGAVVGKHRVLIRDITALPVPGGGGGVSGVDDGADGLAMAGKGAPPKKAAPRPSNPLQPDANGMRKKSRVPPEYEDANATPFASVEVKAEAQTLTFDVVTKGKTW